MAKNAKPIKKVRLLFSRNDMLQSSMQKLLVQACCGGCASSDPTDYLYGEINRADTFIRFFFNGDNFDTSEEYRRRLAAFNTVSKHYKIESIVEPYSEKIFEKCEDCIKYRLECCAQVAKEQNFDCFTTTLTVSPHKDTATVNQIGREVAVEYGVPFLELDLKKNGGFEKTVKASKELGIYRQNYCGCAKSRR